MRIILLVWYEDLAAEIPKSAVLRGDETEWRLNGETHWLWCFSNGQTTFSVMDREKASVSLL
ncbi:MAG: hypothetical protein AB1656_07185 [Candidatus Omnitrophota bacterium]